jgi:hypothetical protein
MVDAHEAAPTIAQPTLHRLTKHPRAKTNKSRLHQVPFVQTQLV